MQDQDYKIIEVQPRKEWTGNYGTFQDYALRLQEVSTKVVLDSWVSLSQKPETPAPAVGGHIHGHTESQTSSKGTTYLKFKKVNAQYANGYNQPTAAANPTALVGQEKTLEYIVEMLEELTGKKSDRPNTVDNDLSIIDDGEDFDPSEIPF